MCALPLNGDIRRRDRQVSFVAVINLRLLDHLVGTRLRSGSRQTERCVLIASAASMLPFGTLSAAAEPVITVHRDPNCGCCLGWVQHLQKAGFPTKVLETKDLDAVKTRLGVPDDLAACHTAEVAVRVLESHHHRPKRSSNVSVELWAFHALPMPSELLRLK